MTELDAPERLLEIQPAANRSRGLWVVHRIDRHVSGLVVVARRAGALEALREQFAARTPLREYLALAEGRPPSPQGDLRSWLAEEPRTRKVFPTRPDRGREAVLRYRKVDQTLLNVIWPDGSVRAPITDMSRATAQIKIAGGSR